MYIFTKSKFAVRSKATFDRILLQKSDLIIPYGYGISAIDLIIIISLSRLWVYPKSMDWIKCVVN